MDALANLLAIAALLLFCLSAVAAFVPKIAMTDRPSAAFATYALLGIITYSLALWLSPPPADTPTQDNSEIVQEQK